MLEMHSLIVVLIVGLDVKRILVHVERRDRHAARGPHAVVVDAACHHVDQHLIVADRPGRQHLELHGGFGRTMPLLADCPGVHARRHMAERRHLADVVEVFRRARGGRL